VFFFLLFFTWEAAADDLAAPPLTHPHPQPPLCVASGQGSNNFKRRCSSRRKQKARRTAQGKTTNESITLAEQKKLAKSKSDLIPFSSGLRSGRRPGITTPYKINSI